MRIDLHLHTTASDGRFTPAEVVRQAAAMGMDVIAITDHDTVAGVAPALEAAKAFPSLMVIPGVEINTETPESEVHILGYFVNYASPELNDALASLRGSRRDRGRKMVAKLAELGIAIEWERVLEVAEGGAVGRPHVARALLEKGYVSSLPEAFTKYIGRKCPAYVPRSKLTSVEAVELILRVGGLPVLGHPADIGHHRPLLPKLIRAGVVGMEVFYNGYRGETIRQLHKVAERHNLIPLGGSDYHGLDGAGSELGSVEVPEESLTRLVALARKRGLPIP